MRWPALERVSQQLLCFFVLRAHAQSCLPRYNTSSSRCALLKIAQQEYYHTDNIKLAMITMIMCLKLHKNNMRDILY